jgi:hypothetical protein
VRGASHSTTLNHWPRNSKMPCTPSGVKGNREREREREGERGRERERRRERERERDNRYKCMQQVSLNVKFPDDSRKHVLLSCWSNPRIKKCWIIFRQLCLIHYLKISREKTVKSFYISVC